MLTKTFQNVTFVNLNQKKIKFVRVTLASEVAASAVWRVVCHPCRGYSLDMYVSWGLGLPRWLVLTLGKASSSFQG